MVAEVVGLVDFLGNKGVMETHDNFGGPTLLCVHSHVMYTHSCAVM